MAFRGMCARKLTLKIGKMPSTNQNPGRPGVVGVLRQMHPLWWPPIDACLLQRRAMKMSDQIYPFDIFSLIFKRLGAIWKADFSTPSFEALRGNVVGQGWAHSIARPWVPIGSPLTHMVYLWPFGCNFKGWLLGANPIVVFGWLQMLLSVYSA